MTDPAAALATRGWARFPVDAASLAWARAAADAAETALADPVLRDQWLVCEGTWFVGVDALPTGPDGAVAGVALAGAAVSFLGAIPPLHPAQLSAVFPGYPRPRDGESAAAFRYRRDRCAAHVDGIIADGPDRRRKVLEPHAWILGIGLADAPHDAAPLTVWDGSHRVMADALIPVLQAAQDPAQADVTEVYQAARRTVFDRCPRRTIPLGLGEAVIVHRHLLHGIAPWSAEPTGRRMTAYFRPIAPFGHQDWMADTPVSTAN